jgi:hypothetical protein
MSSEMTKESTVTENFSFIKKQLFDINDNFMDIISIYHSTIEKNNEISVKLSKLKEKYNDLIKNNTNKVFLFCLNSLYFQYKILNFELENFTKINSLIQNRMYGDYYKLYNIILVQCKENNILFTENDFVMGDESNTLETSETECVSTNQIPPPDVHVDVCVPPPSETYINNQLDSDKKRSLSENFFPVYKDVDPFFRYKIEDVILLHQRILIIIDKLDNIYSFKNETINDHKENVFVGFSLSIFLNTLEYENLLLKGQINLYMEYISFYHTSHKDYLCNLLKKNTEFIDELDSNILINMLSINHPTNFSFRDVNIEENSVIAPLDVESIDNVDDIPSEKTPAFDSPLQSDSLENIDNTIVDETVQNEDQMILDENQMMENICDNPCSDVVIENLSDNMLNVWSGL